VSEQDEDSYINGVIAADEDSYVSLSWPDTYGGFRLYIADVNDEWERCSASFTRDQLIDAAIALLKAAKVTEWMVDRTPRGPGQPR